MCFFARTIAASNRMTGNRRATATIVRMTCSRTSAWRKSSCAVSFHGEAGPVVAVIDVARLPRRAIDALEDDRRVAVVPVVVLEDDRGALVGREVRTVERVDGIGRFGE
jgi:hypothetical protein